MNYNISCERISQSDSWRSSDVLNMSKETIMNMPFTGHSPGIDAFPVIMHSCDGLYDEFPYNHCYSTISLIAHIGIRNKQLIGMIKFYREISFILGILNVKRPFSFTWLAWQISFPIIIEHFPKTNFLHVEVLYIIR